MRVLGLRASWEQVELDVEEWAGRKKEGEERKVQKVWKASGAERVIEVEGKEVKAPFYLSVNAVTLEPDGDVDLKMWHEKGWIHYVESRRDDGTPYRLGQPHECGMY